MGMRKQTQNDAPPPSGEGGWITTYADMITLLMCFFVIMYASSEPSLLLWQIYTMSLTQSMIILKKTTQMSLLILPRTES